jgi:hypothetical protein
LFVGKAVVDSDGERMVGAKVVAQVVQGLLVELHAFVYLLPLTVVLQQDLEGTH